MPIETITVDPPLFKEGPLQGQGFRVTALTDSGETINVFFTSPETADPGYLTFNEPILKDILSGNQEEVRLYKYVGV